MSIIRNAAPDSSAGILAQQFAKRPGHKATNTQASSPALAIPATEQPDNPNPYAVVASSLSNWKDAPTSIGSLSRAPQAISQARKSAAAEMIQRIKTQIRLLIMMNGGTPKARAQQIAQLARQLAAAVQEYASASGGGEQNATAGAASDTTEATANPTPDTGAAGTATAVASAPPAGSAESPNLTQQVSEQIGSKVAEDTQNSSESTADHEFAMEVRKLAAQLKALAKQNEVHSSKNPEKSTDREMGTTNDALQEIERALSNIDSANTAVTVSIDVVAK